MSSIADLLRQGVSSSVSYFRDVIVETGKVRWPNRTEMMRYTVTVIVVCLFMFLLTYAFDLLVTEAFKAIGIGSS